MEVTPENATSVIYWFVGCSALGLSLGVWFNILIHARRNWFGDKK